MQPSELTIAAVESKDKLYFITEQGSIICFSKEVNMSGDGKKQKVFIDKNDLIPLAFE